MRRVFPTYTNSSPLSINLGSIPTGRIGAAYNGAVFQLAAWQIAENKTFANMVSPGPPTSGFYVSSTNPAGAGLVTDANTLLAAVGSATGVTPLNLDSLHSDTAQDYILPDPSGTYIPIPEPDVYAALIGAAALSFVVIFRRRMPA